MTNYEIQKKVKNFKKTFGLTDCTYENLRATLVMQGYTVIEFNHIYNDASVQTLIDSLKLSDGVLHSKGFVYADQNYRLVFIHEDLNEQEKRMIAAHENGHIFLKHLKTVPIIGKDVADEYEANEFAHYLLNKSIADTLIEAIRKHKKKLIYIFLTIVLIVSGFLLLKRMSREQTYYGEYYITTSGNKYHEKECIFVKNKNNVFRLTEEEFKSGNYEPCKTCLPQ